MQWFLQDISIGENLKILRGTFGYYQNWWRNYILWVAICHAALIPKSKLALGIYGLATFSP